MFRTHGIARRTILSALFAVLCWAGCGHFAAAEENVSLRLNWFASGYNAPFYVGVDKGFYKEVGLNVDVQEGQGGGPTVAQVAAGQSMFGFATIDAPLRANVQGAPVKIIASMAKDAGFCVLVKADSGINKPTDLVGKKFASVAASSLGLMLPAYLKAAGVPLDKVTRLTVDASSLNSGFIGGQFESKAALSFDEVPKLESQGVHVRCLAFSDVGLKMLGHVLVATQSTIDSKPKVVQDFVTATLKAYKYSFEHPEEAVALAKKHSPEALADERSAVGQLEVFRGLATEPLGSLSLDGLKSTAVLLRDNLGLAANVDDLKPFYSDRFVPMK